MSKTVSRKRTLARGFSTVFGKGLHDDTILEKFRPVTIVAIMSFDHPIDIVALRQIMLTRLVGKWARFRSTMAMEGGHVVFDELDADELDLDYHVTLEDSKGWDDADWDKFLCRIYSTVKDVTRPLWRWHVCNDLKNGQSRIIWNIDHCVVDGVSLAYCVNNLFDPDEGVPYMAIKPDKAKAARPKPEVLPPKPNVLQQAWWFVSGVSEGFFSMAYPADPPSPMKLQDIQNPCREKRFSNAETIPLAKVQEIKNKFGVTVNDVLGGLLNMTVQRYLTETEPDNMTANRSMRINFPINMRSAQDMLDPEIGNIISTGMIKVALQHRSAYEAMMEHHCLMQRIKSSPTAIIQMKLLDIAAKLLPYEFLVSAAFILYGKFTLMMSNIPGPPKARPINGNMCKDVHFYLFVPIGIYCGFISYDGRMSFTVSTDAGTTTRPEEITRIWGEEFDKLHAQVMAPDFKPTWKPSHGAALTQTVATVGIVGAAAGLIYLLARRG